MIDNVKIWIENFSGDFSNCTKSRNTNKQGITQYCNYNLKSIQSIKPSYLELNFNNDTGVLKITGSIRKWYFNEDSLLDLSKDNLENAFKRIANLLNISCSDLYNARFTQSEIGQNVKISVPSFKLIPNTVKYTNQYEYLDYGYFESTSYFVNSKKELIIYDKLDEIAYKNTKGKILAMQTLKTHEHHFVRLEFNLYNKSSRNLKSIKHIKNLGHLVEYYEDVWTYWKDQVKQIIVYSKVSTDSKLMNRKEINLGKWLNRTGFEMVETYLKNNAKSTTYDGLQSKKTRIKNNLVKFMEKYATSGSYTKEMFLCDLDAHISKKEAKNID